MCSSTLGCAYQGEKDISRHVLTENHKRNMAARSTQSKLPFLAASDPLVDKVTCAEVRVAAMLVRNNIPLSQANKLTPLFQDIFQIAILQLGILQGEQKQCVLSMVRLPHISNRIL